MRLDEIKRLGQLVGAMLRLAPTDAAPLVGVEPVDLIALADTVVAAHPRARGASAAVTVEYDAEPAWGTATQKHSKWLFRTCSTTPCAMRLRRRM